MSITSVHVSTHQTPPTKGAGLITNLVCVKPYQRFVNVEISY